ncbi:MAG: hypothetical protein GX163_11930 [Bacteroidetes bacterium]|jgi:flagellar hook-basal body complex protein FliE|nr:hypothetical protein [Bacteroidota bacterium]
MNASKENHGGKFKILVGVLSLLLIALGVYTVSLFNENKQKVSNLETQKAEIQRELEGLLANYNEIIEENELKDREIIEARDRITILLDSVKKAQADLKLLHHYRNKIDELEKERQLLFKKADSLIAINKVLIHQRDSTHTELEISRTFADSILQANESMNETIRRAAVVKARNLKGEAVIIRKNGKVVNTNRASRADKIRACFTLTENAIAPSGVRTLYVQVINPKNNIVGERSFIQFEEGSLFYSATTDVFYENEELDVCIMVDVSDAELIEGSYIFNVFDESNLIASSNMQLK